MKEFEDWNVDVDKLCKPLCEKAKQNGISKCWIVLRGTEERPQLSLCPDRVPPEHNDDVAYFMCHDGDIVGTITPAAVLGFTSVLRFTSESGLPVYDQSEKRRRFLGECAWNAQ